MAHAKAAGKGGVLVRRDCTAATSATQAATSSALQKRPVGEHRPQPNKGPTRQPRLPHRSTKTHRCPGRSTVQQTTNHKPQTTNPQTHCDPDKPQTTNHCDPDKPQTTNHCDPDKPQTTNHCDPDKPQTQTNTHRAQNKQSASRISHPPKQHLKNAPTPAW